MQEDLNAIFRETNRMKESPSHLTSTIRVSPSNFNYSINMISFFASHGDLSRFKSTFKEKHPPQKGSTMDFLYVYERAI